MTKRLLVLGLAIVLMVPLGGCIDGLVNGITNIAGAGTDQILEDIDAGVDAGKAEAQSKVDTWIDQQLAGGGLPDGSACTDNPECASNNCAGSAPEDPPGSGTCQP
jgi:hypothetical protein